VERPSRTTLPPMDALPDRLRAVSESPTTLALWERQSSESELELEKAIKGWESNLESTALQPNRPTQMGRLTSALLKEEKLRFDLRLIQTPPRFSISNNVNYT
jgi:hypothetical protein